MKSQPRGSSRAAVNSAQEQRQRLKQQLFFGTLAVVLILSMVLSLLKY